MGDMEEEVAIAMMENMEEEYNDVTLKKNKLSARDRAKILYNLAKLEIENDNSKHERLYNAISGDQLHVPALVDTELDDLMKGLFCRLITFRNLLCNNRCKSKVRFYQWFYNR